MILLGFWKFFRCHGEKYGGLVISQTASMISHEAWTYFDELKGDSIPQILAEAIGRKHILLHELPVCRKAVYIYIPLVAGCIWHIQNEVETTLNLASKFGDQS